MILDINQLKKIKKKINHHGYFILRNEGKFSKKDINTSLNIIRRKCLSSKNSKKDLKRFVSNPLDLKNYQRHVIEEFGNPRTIRAHNYTQIINPIWAKDIYKLRKYFVYLCKLRNLLLGKNQNFCVDSPVGTIYSLSRIQYYPSGGGFMATHKDDRGQRVNKKSGLKNYFQILFLMTKKGKDFETGGGYIIKNNKRIIHDDYTDQGDIIIYDGNIEHGVSTIDSYLPLNNDNKRLKGRFVLAVNFYNTSISARSI